MGTKTDAKYFEKNKEFQNRIELRDLIVYEYDSIKSNTPFRLIIRQKDSITIYDYKSTADTTKNMSIRYVKHSEKIYFGHSEFSVSNTNDYKTDIFFDRYELDVRIIDGMGPILFNKEYGVLGLHNGWGKEFYFTTKNNEDKIDFSILH